MLRDEVRRTVVQKWQEAENNNMYTVPRDVATRIREVLGESVPTEAIVYAFNRMPTHEHIDGALEVLSDLLQQGDSIVIWTRGDRQHQLSKVAGAGIAALRRTLPRSRSERKTRLSEIADIDKFADLPGKISIYEQRGVRNFLFVDDDTRNITTLQEKQAEWRKAGSIASDTTLQPIWVNQGPLKDKVPHQHTLQSFTAAIPTIHDIRELQAIKKQLPRENVWFIDLDYTLLDTNAARQPVFDTITNLYRLEEGSIYQ